MDTTETVSFCCLMGQLEECPCLFSFAFLSDQSLVICLQMAKQVLGQRTCHCSFPKQQARTTNIQIPRSSSELHPAPFMRDVCYVRGLGPSCKSKQNVLSLILLISLMKLMNQNRSICRHHIFVSLTTRAPVPQ